jgi:predicted component of type VI protein secretion system
MGISLLLALLCVFFLGCAASELGKEGNGLPTGENVIVIDVRTAEEYNSGELSRSKILLIRFHGSVFYSASFRWRFHSPQATSMS